MTEVSPKSFFQLLGLTLLHLGECFLKYNENFFAFPWYQIKCAVFVLMYSSAVFYSKGIYLISFVTTAYLCETETFLQSVRGRWDVHG